MDGKNGLTRAQSGHFRSIAKGPFRHAHRFVALISKAGIANATIPPYGGPSPACTLLTKEEFAKITDRRLYSDADGTQLTSGGSACDFDSGNVTLFSGPKSAENYEQLLKKLRHKRRL
jgi:hypothetical protein